jgi:tetratricopeptide (TPR) repeat protein/tRNA A-37 threonylcarbamoyl transferase component Bud32
MLERHFGKYEMIRRLGRGGMADVYLAHDAECGRQVALKLVEEKSDRESREILAAEQRGAMLQQQFGAIDSHVPEVHGVGSCDEYFYIDMEYVDGEDLAERLVHGPLAPETAVYVATEVCSFLQQAHSFEADIDGARFRGIIHGDIKPKNIRINRDGNVKVLDFGIAKGLSLTRKLTRNDFGSLGYLSPERLETGDVNVDSDLWSVGVLLYEMLAGVPPFDHRDAQRLERLIRSRETPPPLPDTCPPALVRVVMKMLAPSLRRRYRTAESVLADLGAVLTGGPTQADREWLADDEETQATRRTGPAAEAVAGALADRSPDESEAAQVGVEEREGQEVAAGDAALGSAGVEAAAGPGEGCSREPTAEPDVNGEGTPCPAPPDHQAEATRRTAPVVLDEDTEATRRTTARGPTSASADGAATGSSTGFAPAGAGRVPSTGPLTGRLRRVRRIALVSAAVVVAGLLLNESSVWSAARGLRVDLATRQSSEVGTIWDRYQALSRRSLLGFGLIGIRGPLKERLVSRADQVIADYRQDTPTVREAQWVEAAQCLTNALRLDPGDRTVAASLRYCQGQVQRINGEARKRRQEASADRLLYEAIARFEEAAKMNPRWPDPYLGLARTYIYGMGDLDKAIAALQEAENRGYRAGNRELVQMADGYRRRADMMQARADEVRGLPQETECLQKAVEDYRQALDLYSKAIGFGEAGASIKQVQKQYEAASARLDSLTKESESGVRALLRSIFGRGPSK